MEDGSVGSRPKRRCSSRSKQSAAPSAVHYVGYVEEDETPEAIMKKFEELDKVIVAGLRSASTSLITTTHKYICYIIRSWLLGTQRPAHPSLPAILRERHQNNLSLVCQQDVT